jgi:hypothetical protein
MVKFRATVIPSGNATAIEVPETIVNALGPEGRPLIVITINGHSWRSRLAAMRGLKLIGISAAHRASADIVEGDIIDVDVVRDDQPRMVTEPSDLADALNGVPQARASFDRLPFGLKQKHVASIADAKSVDVRQHRIDKLVTSLSEHR